MARPDDSHDPLFDEQPQGTLARILPPLVLICAFGGFVALAIYAYRAGTQSVGDGELMVIEADKTPIKEKPEDPGGMQFPNQDKTIFETFANGQQPAKVERVLPTPEEPMPQDADASGTTSWVNEKLATATPAAPAGAEQVFGDEDAAPAAPVTPQVVNVQEALGKQAVEAAPSAPAPVAEPVPEQTKAVELTPKSAFNPPAKEPVKEVVKEEKLEVKETAPAPVEKPKAVAVKPSAGKQLVQLGAYKSEVEAKGDFVKIQKKHAALAGKSAVINRADLGDKGVFYRLRVATDDAKALCAKLSGSGQACMVVK